MTLLPYTRAMGPPSWAILRYTTFLYKFSKTKLCFTDIPLKSGAEKIFKVSLSSQTTPSTRLDHPLGLKLPICTFTLKFAKSTRFLTDIHLKSGAETNLLSSPSDQTTPSTCLDHPLGLKLPICTFT